MMVVINAIIMKKAVLMKVLNTKMAKMGTNASKNVHLLFMKFLITQHLKKNWMNVTKMKKDARVNIIIIITQKKRDVI